MVVDHLHDHPADCQNLFSSDAKQPQNDNDHPLGKDKVSVCAVIMKYVFQNDAEYVDYYTAEPEKFQDSMNSHINRLRRKYCNSYDKLHVTGTGIMLEDEAQNLHAQIMKEFPWYDELVGIMEGNLAISLKMVSSRPGVDHAAKYFSISCTAGSSYSESLGSGSAQFSAHPQPISAHPSAQSQLPPSGTQPYPPPSGTKPYPPSGAEEDWEW
ncbi:hypothetical protein EDB19DRAFT_1915652 [Suillus lakei]|nr:hypothetical protein EDB19DRAFT_1915652 [Suillus lakei]